MEIDLNRLQLHAEPIRAQVCIVGAGIAGLTLAWRLEQLGIDVALLESGGLTLTGPNQTALAAAELAGHPHLGTSEGRFRVFGGSSLAWGGQLLPLPDVAGWPVSAHELAPYTQQAERLLGVDDLPYEAAAFFPAAHLPAPPLLHLPGWHATLSKWTPFARRNLAANLGPGLIANDRVRVYLHAAVTELLPSASGRRIDSLLARDSSGRTARFLADQFVLAAGTVEASRLLLASRSVLPAGVGNAHDQVGRNFHDHLTLPIAEVTGPARAALLRDLRPWILRRHGHTTVHSAKLERQTGDLIPHHAIQAHLTLEDPTGSPLAALRERLSARQRGLAAPPFRLPQLPAAARELAHLAWSAAIERRRYVPSTTRARLFLNAAQPTPTRSLITLSETVDATGTPLALVDWRIEPEELADLRTFAAALRTALDTHTGLDHLNWLPELFAAEGPLPGLLDARHAMGGLCMGFDPATSVVDPALAVHGIVNLSIASAAVFPNGAAAMPALPLLALTLRLAERLAQPSQA